MIRTIGLLLLVLNGAWAQADDAAPVVEPSSGVAVQAIQVPDENLIEKIRRYLPGQARSLSPAQWADLMEKNRARAEWNKERVPLAGALRGTFDPLSGRLSGTSEWKISRDGSSRLSMRPWSPLVREVASPEAQAGSVTWGSSSDSTLRVLGLPSQAEDLIIGWEELGVGRSDGFAYRLRLPSSSLTHLELEIPNGWDVSTSVPTSKRGSKALLMPDGTGTIAFSLVRAESGPFGSTVSSVTTLTECLVRDEVLALRVQFTLRRVGSDDRPIVFRADGGSDFRPVPGPVGDWTTRAMPDGGQEWSFRPAGPPLDVYVFAFETVVPTDRPSVENKGRLKLPTISAVESEDLFDDFVLIVPETHHLRSLDPGSYRMVGTTVDDQRQLRLAFRGAEPASRPSFSVAPRAPVLWAEGGFVLDLTADPKRLSGSFDLTVESGQVNLVEAILPTGWRLISARAEPGGSLKPIESGGIEASDDLSVSLTLPKPLEAGATIHLEVVAEQADGLRRDQATDETLVLPEIRWPTVRSRRSFTYTLRLSNGSLANLDSLPPPTFSPPSNGAHGTAKKGDKGETYSFSFVSPLPKSTITLPAAAPRFRGRLDHHIRWRENDWHQELSLDLTVIQGSLESIHVVSNRPLPEGLVWTTGPENSVVGFERFPETPLSSRSQASEIRRDEAPDEVPDQAPDENEGEGSEQGASGFAGREFHYQLRTALPVRSSIRLSAQWEDSVRSIEPPLLLLPDAQDFSASVEVASRTGREIDIDTRGLVSVDPPSGGASHESAIIWAGQYDPLEHSALLKLRVSDEPTVSASPYGRAVIRCQSRVESDVAVQTVDLFLDSRQAGPLHIRLPEDSYVWQVVVDGVSRTPGVQQQVLEVVPRLEPGSHTCRLVFSSPMKPWFGLTHVTLPIPLEGWDQVSSTWTIERMTGAYLYADPSLQLISHLQDLSPPASQSLVVMTEGPSARETAAWMEAAFLAIPEEDRARADRVLSALAQNLLVGGVLVIDQQLEDLPTRTAGKNLGDWLSRRGLTVMVWEESVLVARRGPSQLGSRVVANWNWESWAGDIVQEARAHGRSRDGEFVAVGSEWGNVLLDRLDEYQSAGARPVAWTYSVEGSSDGVAYDVLMVSRELLTRLGRVGVLVSIVLVTWFGSRWNLVAHRRFLIVALSASFIVACAGGWAHHVLSVPLWTAIAASVMLMLRRLSRRPSAPVIGGGVVGASLFLSVAPLHAEDLSTPQRILIPVSPAGEVRQVIVPESLIQKLSPSSELHNRVLFKRAEYRGKVLRSGRARWTAILSGTIERLGDNRQATLPLGGIESGRIEVNGASIGTFQGSANQAGIDFELPPAESGGVDTFRVEVEFESAVIGRADEQSLVLDVPAASVTDVRLQVEAGVSLDDTSRAEGWQETTIDGQPLLSLERGPTSTVSVRWRRPAPAGDEKLKLDVESIRLIEVNDATVRLSGIFRLKLPAHRSEVVFSLSRRLVIREVLGQGVRDWRLLPRGDDARELVVELEPGQESRTITLRAETGVDPTGPFLVPEMSVADASTETGVLGVRASEDWRTELVRMERGQETTPADFWGTWSRLSVDPAPPAIRNAVRVRLKEGELPWSLTLALIPPTSTWQVEQEIQALLDPVWRSTMVEAKVRVKGSEAPSEPLAIDLPEGVEVVRVAGEEVKDWFVQDDMLGVVVVDNKSNEWMIDLSLRYPWELSAKRATGKMTRSLVPFRWQGAKETTTRWRIRTQPGWVLSDGENRSLPSEAGMETLVRQQTSLDPLTVQLVPEARELSADMLTRMTIRDRQTEIEGVIVLHVDRGRIGRLEFRTSGGLRNLQWDVDNITPPTSEERGGERIWVLRSGSAVPGDLTLRWRTSKLYDSEQASIPRLVLDTPARVRDWVSVVNLTGRRLELTTKELVATPLPANMASLGSPLATNFTRGDQTYLASSKDWQVSFALNTERIDSPAFRVLSVDHDLVVGLAGQIRGRSTWQIVDDSEGVVEIERGSATSCDRVTVGEMPLERIGGNESTLRVPLYRFNAPTRWVMEWSCPTPVSAEALDLPTIATEGSYPSTLRVRHSRTSRLQITGGEPIDRFTWLTRRLARLVEDMEGEAIPTLDAESRVELSEAMAEARQLEQDLVAVSASAAGGDARVASVRAQADEAMAKRHELEDRLVGLLGEELLLSERSESSRFWNSLDGLAASTVGYFESNEPLQKLELSTRSRFEWRMITTNEWVRIALSALALVLVSVDRLWASMRIYWPAPMLMAGLAWVMFADSPLIGWGLVGIALYGGVQSASRWLEGNLVDAASTILVSRTVRTTSPDKTSVSPNVS